MRPEDKSAPGLNEHHFRSGFKVCRFAYERIEYESIVVTETEYFTISRVWETASRRKVKNWDKEILVSEEKAKFIEEQLPTLVGDHYFWMDVLWVSSRGTSTSPNK